MCVCVWQRRWFRSALFCCRRHSRLPLWQLVCSPVFPRSLTQISTISQYVQTTFHHLMYNPSKVSAYLHGRTLMLSLPIRSLSQRSNRAQAAIAIHSFSLAVCHLRTVFVMHCMRCAHSSTADVQLGCRFFQCELCNYSEWARAERWLDESRTMAQGTSDRNKNGTKANKRMRKAASGTYACEWQKKSARRNSGDANSGSQLNTLNFSWRSIYLRREENTRLK